MEESLSFESVYVGMRVRDNDEDFGVGTVKECENAHNVFVVFDNEATGIFCLVKNCSFYNKLFAVVE